MVRVGRNRLRVLDLQAVRRGAGLARGAGLGRLRVRRRRCRSRRVAGLRRCRCRCRGRLAGRRDCESRLGRCLRGDLGGHLARHVLGSLVTQVDSQNVRAPTTLLSVGERHVRLVLLLVLERLLVHTGQGVRDERPQRPVDRGGRRLGSLVVQHVEKGVDHLGVGLIVRGHVDGLGVATLVGQPHLQAVLAVRLLEEVSQPGVGVQDREVSDLGVAERLRVGVAEGRVTADLAGELGELGSLARGGERRRDAVHPEATFLLNGLARVVDELVGTALGRVGEKIPGLDGQVGCVAGLFGRGGCSEEGRCDQIPRQRRGKCCHCHGCCCQDLPLGLALYTFHHGEDRREDDEDEDPVASSQCQNRQCARAHDERDAREGVAGTEGPDQDDHSGGEPQGRPVEAEVVCGPHHGKRDSAVRTDASQVGLLAEQSGGRQDHAQENDECVKHRSSVLSWSWGLVATLGEAADCSAYATGVASVVEGCVDAVGDLVDGTGVLRRGLESGELGRGSKCPAVVAGLGHHAEVLANAASVGVRVRTRGGEERTELSEFGVAAFGGGGHGSDDGVEARVEFQRVVVQNSGDEVLGSLLATHDDSLNVGRDGPDWLSPALCSCDGDSQRIEMY